MAKKIKVSEDLTLKVLKYQTILISDQDDTEVVIFDAEIDLLIDALQKVSLEKSQGEKTDGSK